jgi:hypothetical protein
MWFGSEKGENRGRRSQRADTPPCLGPTSAAAPRHTHQASPVIAVTVRTGRLRGVADAAATAAGRVGPSPPHLPPAPTTLVRASTPSLRHISPSSLPRRPPRTAREPPCSRRARRRRRRRGRRRLPAAPPSQEGEKGRPARPPRPGADPRAAQARAQAPSRTRRSRPAPGSSGPLNCRSMSRERALHNVQGELPAVDVEGLPPLGRPKDVHLPAEGRVGRRYRCILVNAICTRSRREDLPVRPRLLHDPGHGVVGVVGRVVQQPKTPSLWWVPRMSCRTET